MDKNQISSIAAKTSLLTKLGCALLLGMLTASEALGLPIGFGRNQRDLEYAELSNEHFTVYFDKRTPREGRAIINSLEAARPIMERWFAIRRTRGLPVIMSSTTANPSFANFITDALELQTMGRGGRDLAWHEFTHNMMYRHFDNFFGPVGNVIHLPWLPAWWLEGLAEATSNSIGSDRIYSVERTTALSGNWPSYAKLHSLYNGRFSFTGYAISGSFVSYILRRYGGDQLPKVLQDFYDYTMPWWWPWTFVPFNDFMPFDGAMVDLTGKTGEQLYEEYKLAAKAHWSRASPGRSLKQKVMEHRRSMRKQPKARMGSRTLAYSALSLRVREARLYDVVYDQSRDELFEVELRQNPRTLAFTRVRTQQLPSDATTVRVSHGPSPVFVHRSVDAEREIRNTVSIGSASSPQKRFRRRATIRRLFLSGKYLSWIEERRELTRICQLSREKLFSKTKIKAQDIRCPWSIRYPHLAEFMGEKFRRGAGGQLEAREIWLAQKTETLLGDRYKILKFSPDQQRLTEVPNPLRGKPLSVVFQGDSPLLLLAHRTGQVFRSMTPDGRCLQEYTNPSHINFALGDETSLFVGTSEGTRRWIYKTTLASFQARPCRQLDEPRSPLNYAMAHPNASFAEALRFNHPWQSFPEPVISPLQGAVDQAPSLEKDMPGPKLSIQEAAWRPRPVFALPWIGADARGYQLGTISVPLMDHMQNETLSLTALYGVFSRFPSLELDFSSTRFKTTLSARAFKRQVWNGRVSFRESSDPEAPISRDLFFFEERGVELRASRFLPELALSLQAGASFQDKKPYIGRSDIWEQLAKGYSNEFFFGFSQNWVLGRQRLNYSVLTRMAPEQLNNNFKFDRLNLGTGLSIPLSLFSLNTTQSMGLSYSRTRGKRRAFLREVYFPLRTFVPGTGGGFNEINVGILGPGFLTSPTFGDTQGRFRWAWTFPLVSQLETLLHIFYLERLDFTAFFNYGNAWDQRNIPEPEDFIAAHGYNLDLQSDIKGVTVNLGVGVGQVLEQDWEMYFLFGFDALINP